MFFIRAHLIIVKFSQHEKEEKNIKYLCEKYGVDKKRNHKAKIKGMSSTYCKLPLLHLYSQPDGEVKPCCIKRGFDEPLNLKKMSIEDTIQLTSNERVEKRYVGR